MFPTVSQILNQYLITISVSVFVLIVVLAFSLWRIISTRKDAEAGKSDLRPWLFAVAGLLLWIAGAYLFNAPMFRALRHRVAPEQIAEIRVTKLGTDKSAVINDREIIANGFKVLPNAKGYSLENERLLPDGYGIDIKLEGTANYSPLRLTAHRQSRQGASGVQEVNVVAISTDPNSQGLILSSVAFHNWLRRNVDPLFAPPPLVVP